MVTRRAFLPTLEELELLKALSSPTIIYQRPTTIAQPRVVYLSAAGGSIIAVASHYEDVTFKFEEFYLVVTRADLEEPRVEIGRIPSWDQWVCLFRTDWERPAFEGEVPPSWEQVVQRRGLRSMVPSDALAVGVSFVGLAFSSAAQAVPSAVLICDKDDDPGAIQLITDGEKIRSILDESDRVAPDAFKSWSAELQAWMSQK